MSVMPPPPVESPARETIQPVHLTDTCDRCRARAYVRVVIAGAKRRLSLSFCSHHFSKYEGALNSLAIDIIDHRSALAPNVVSMDSSEPAMSDKPSKGDEPSLT